MAGDASRAVAELRQKAAAVLRMDVTSAVAASEDQLRELEEEYAKECVVCCEDLAPAYGAALTFATRHLRKRSLVLPCRCTQICTSCAKQCDKDFRAAKKELLCWKCFKPYSSVVCPK